MNQLILFLPRVQVVQCPGDADADLDSLIPDQRLTAALALQSIVQTAVHHELVDETRLVAVHTDTVERNDVVDSELTEHAKLGDRLAEVAAILQAFYRHGGVLPVATVDDAEAAGTDHIGHVKIVGGGEYLVVRQVVIVCVDGGRDRREGGPKLTGRLTRMLVLLFQLVHIQMIRVQLIVLQVVVRQVSLGRLAPSPIFLRTVDERILVVEVQPMVAVHAGQSSILFVLPALQRYRRVGWMRRFVPHDRTVRTIRVHQFVERLLVLQGQQRVQFLVIAQVVQTRVDERLQNAHRSQMLHDGQAFVEVHYGDVRLRPFADHRVRGRLVAQRRLRIELQVGIV